MTERAAAGRPCRISGSGAFGEAARSVLAFARHPDDPDGEKGIERVIVHAKSNWGRYAPTLACRVESRLVDLPDDDRADVGFLVITGESDITAEDLVVTGRSGDDDQRADLEAREFLEYELVDRQWHESRAVKAAAATAGIAERTLQRAREQLDVEVTREGFHPGTGWRLPVVPSPMAQRDGTTEKPGANDAVTPIFSLDDVRRANTRGVGTTDATDAAPAGSDGEEEPDDDRTDQ